MSHLRKRITNLESNYSCFFATVVYPSTAPANWKKVCIDEGDFPVLIGALHENSHHLAHFHVLMLFPKKVSKNFAISYANSFGGVGAEYMKDIKHFYDYLAH